MIFLTCVITLVLLSVFVMGAKAQRRLNVDYKKRWLEATRLLSGDEPPTPRVNENRLWHLTIESSKGLMKFEIGQTEEVDATWFHAERREPHYQQVLLDSVINAQRYRSGEEKRMSTPEVIAKHRRECIKVINEMNEDERVHND